jgi:hypothetical protein
VLLYSNRYSRLCFGLFTIASCVTCVCPPLLCLPSCNCQIKVKLLLACRAAMFVGGKDLPEDLNFLRYVVYAPYCCIQICD